MEIRVREYEHEHEHGRLWLLISWGVWLSVVVLAVALAVFVVL